VSDLVHDHMKYGGFQAKINISLAQMRETIEIDVGVGDFVNHRRKNVKLMQGKGKPIFEEEITLLVYPPETILAEKLHTAVARREQNSRMKDYYDIFTILSSDCSSIESNKEAIIATFRHREMSINTLPLNFTDAELQTLQKYWSLFHKAIKNKIELSMEIEQIIASINLKLLKLGFK
jgi:predicted nucleotidyltransferase component of viral defense system